MIESCITDIKSFYKHLDGLNFDDVSQERIFALKEYGLYINEIIINNPHSRFSRTQRYTKVMNGYKTCPKKYNIESKVEMYILFMFTVDPEFNIALIYGNAKSSNEIKFKVEKQLGIFDPYLVKIEKIVLKKLSKDIKISNKNKSI